MNIKKIKTHELEKCYAIGEIMYNDKKHILVAAEKVNKCKLFLADGTFVEDIWDEPGGTMSIVAVPGANGQFLATQKFYSPNDSKESKIVVVTPTADGWKINTLMHLPHVHRFDIILRDGVYYLIACTLCSGRDFKDDWAHKGKVYAAVLPSELTAFSDENQFTMDVVKDEMLKNHGYYRIRENGYESAAISCEEGVYKFTPPAKGEHGWGVEQLLSTPASDALLADFDGDSKPELLVFSPFHGAGLDIYRNENGTYENAYTHAEPFDFSHALWAYNIGGKDIAFLGHRGGKRQLIAISHCDGEYRYEVLDDDVGPANVLCFEDGGKTYLVAANRETDEIAWYEVN